MNEDIYKLFDCNSEIDCLEKIKNDKDKEVYFIISLLFLYNKDIFNSILYFSKTVSGQEHNDLKSIIKYIMSLDREKVMYFSKQMMTITGKEDLKIPKEYKYETIGVKSKTEYEKRYSKELQEIGFSLIDKTKIGFSLKLFSEMTTDIEFYKIKDFLDYLNLTFKKEEMINFKNIISGTKK